MVEPGQTPYSGRMGERPPRTCQRCRELHLVAVAHSVAKGQQGPAKTFVSPGAK